VGKEIRDTWTRRACGGSGRKDDYLSKGINSTAIGPGMPWRDAPNDLAISVVHTRCSRWSKLGCGNEVFQHLADDADNEYATPRLCIAHQHSAGGKGEKEQEAIKSQQRRIEHQNSCSG